MIREKIRPIVCFKEAAVVTRLDNAQVRGEAYAVPSTIDDTASLGEIEETLKRLEYAKKVVLSYRYFALN